MFFHIHIFNSFVFFSTVFSFFFGGGKVYGWFLVRFSLTSPQVSTYLCLWSKVKCIIMFIIALALTFYNAI